MTFPKSASTRDKRGRCDNCNGTLLACKGLTRDLGRGCCQNCTHQENSDGNE